MDFKAYNLLHCVVTFMANVKTMGIRLSVVMPCFFFISANRAQVNPHKLTDSIDFITNVTSVLLTIVWLLLMYK